MCHRRFNVWDFFTKFFNGKNKKHICQSADPTLYSEVAAAKAYLERKQARVVSKLSQPIICDSNSSDRDSEDADSGALWKESETEYIPTTASLRRRRIEWRQTNIGSHWTREQPCLRCKAKRTRKWLSQHFFNPMPPPHGKNSSLEENSSRGITIQLNKVKNELCLH
uniref:Uncharacterized protein n=1 Tax=Pelusios castaneus TaxID=367368 RepID=A0A8C8SNJ3_9SAUR